MPSTRRTRWGLVAASLLAGLTLAAGVRAQTPPCPASTPQHLELPATRAAILARRPVVIVALGSSSTEGAGASAPDRAYPARLAQALAGTWPGVAVSVLNRGKGGQDADTMLARLDTDVLAAAPTLVIWQLGANAALRAMNPTEFGTLLDDGVRRIRARGADVVLMDNQVAPSIVAQPGFEVYGNILAQEAARRHVALYSRTALMREWGGTDPDGGAMIGPDGLHHSDRGYACVAAALRDSIVASVLVQTPAVAAVPARPRQAATP